MADVKWIKVTTDVFDDEKILLIESLPEADSIIVIWFKLLCLAGKQNNSGVFMMSNSIPYTDKMLATIFRRKETTVQLALQTFEQFGMVELIDNVITIPNWGKHQNFDKIEKNNEYMREYMREYRQKQRSLSCKTNSKTNSKVNSKTNSKVNVSALDKNRKEKNREEKTTIYAGNPKLDKAINNYVAHRESINKPLTPSSLDILLDNLNKLSSDINEQIEILNQSVVKGWVDIYPLKKKQTNSNNNNNTTNANAKAKELEDFYEMTAKWAEGE